MRFSLNKVRNIWSSVPHEDFLSYLFSYPLMHDSYREITKGNYVRESGMIGGKWYKGFKPSFGATKYDKFPEVTEILEGKAPSEKNRKYLEKMVSLAEERGIELVFVVVPYEGWQAEDEAIYFWIEKFAEDNDILYFNGNHNLAEMSFDPAADYAEASHLNYNGACKFTRYFGQWLKSNCELEDRRGDAAYESWQQYSDCWSAYQRDRELAQIDDLRTYIEKLQSNGDYMIFVSVDDNYKNNPYADLLQGLSSETISYNFESNGTIVIETGTILYRTPDEPEYLWHMETDSLDIAVTRDYGGQMKVLVNNEEKNDNYNDVTLLVYDKKLDMVADVAAYNSDGIMIR